MCINHTKFNTLETFVTIWHALRISKHMLRTVEITRMKQYIPIIVDVEASGFGSSSYPIEIGLALPDGERYCALIAPEPSWIHWDPKAEALHGLSREKLISNGKSPKEICQKLNSLLKGKTLYSDAWTFDYPWIRTLFNAAKEEDFQTWDSTKEAIRKKIDGKRHRASLDARIIQETYIALQSNKQEMRNALI